MRLSISSLSPFFDRYNGMGITAISSQTFPEKVSGICAPDPPAVIDHAETLDEIGAHDPVKMAIAELIAHHGD